MLPGEPARPTTTAGRNHTVATTNIVLSAYPGRLVSHPSRRYS